MIPFVSIGLSVFNAENFVGYAIKSIINQSFTDFELIITDDGSVDRTSSIIESFVDTRIIYIKDNINRGISYRLNQQIDLARGKYFVRMDADDVMFPNRLEVQVGFLERNLHIDVVGSPAVVIDDDNGIIGVRGSGCSSFNFDKVILRGVFIHPTVTGRIEWFRRYKYVESLKGVEDLDLWIRSFNDSCFCVLENPILFYRDPLSFKTQTYCFRMRQLRVLYKVNKSKMSKKFYYFKLIPLSYFKQYIVVLLHLAKKDRWLIAKRNRAINNSELERYLKILNRLVHL